MQRKGAGPGRPPKFMTNEKTGRILEPTPYSQPLTGFTVGTSSPASPKARGIGGSHFTTGLCFSGSFLGPVMEPFLANEDS
jgi:hypothetical protein